MSGTFETRFDLQEFPFDAQVMTVKAVAFRIPQAVLIPGDNGAPDEHVPFPTRIQLVRGTCKLYSAGFVQSDAWRLHNDLIIRQGRTRPDYHDDGVQQMTLEIAVVVSRKPSFYLFEVALPAFLVVVLSFASFFFRCGQLYERLTISLTMVLTQMTLKFLVSQYIPATSYLTYLDKYIVVCFAYLFLVSVQNLASFIVNMLANPDDFEDTDAAAARRFNTVSGSVLAGVFMLFQIFAFGFSRYMRWKQAVIIEDEYVDTTMEDCPSLTAPPAGGSGAQQQKRATKKRRNSFIAGVASLVFKDADSALKRAEAELEKEAAAAAAAAAAVGGGNQTAKARRASQGPEAMLSALTAQNAYSKSQSRSSRSRKNSLSGAEAALAAMQAQAYVNSLAAGDKEATERIRRRSLDGMEAVQAALNAQQAVAAAEAAKSKMASTDGGMANGTLTAAVAAAVAAVAAAPSAASPVASPRQASSAVAAAAAPSPSSNLVRNPLFNNTEGAAPVAAAAVAVVQPAPQPMGPTPTKSTGSLAAPTISQLAAASTTTTAPPPPAASPIKSPSPRSYSIDLKFEEKSNGDL